MNVKRFHVGWLSTNCYVVSCEETKQAAVIDPGLETKQEGEEILDYINKNGLQVKYIINTHGHSDHVSGNDFMKKATGAQVLIHETAADDVKADKKLKEGDVITVGNFKLAVLHTPGHTPDGICLVGDNVVFTGDSLFAGSIGRTDFVGGSYRDLITSIKTKLLVLPDSFVVYPGHEAFSTIGNEREYNPFLQR
ncbi:MAG: MBL fold metallo-hydrolase [Candidatus Bathyarchaeia archaeon]|jgi:glyoxylase-like metal-dependent hydrolase (beta-lactamase superfamily II)